MARKILFTFELEAGMKVSEDICDSNGRLIIKKGTILDDEIISKLEFFSILEVPIASDTDEVESEETSNDTEAFSERQQAIRNSEVYKKFVADYNNSLETSKELLDNLSE